MSDEVKNSFIEFYLSDDRWKKYNNESEAALIQLLGEVSQSEK